MRLMQTVFVIDELPEAAIEASAFVSVQHLAAISEALNEAGTSALAIVLPNTAHDHTDWRRTLARDLARAHAPKRANVVAATDPEAAEPLLAYLRDAPGVTGQYLEAHD